MLIMQLKEMNEDTEETVLETAREYYGFTSGPLLVIEPRNLVIGSMLLIESRYAFIFEHDKLRRPTEDELAQFKDVKA